MGSAIDSAPELVAVLASHEFRCQTFLHSTGMLARLRSVLGAKPRAQDDTFLVSAR
jgi:hypothetical protein